MYKVERTCSYEYTQTQIDKLGSRIHGLHLCRGVRLPQGMSCL